MMCITTLGLAAQENTSLTCGDGIDNDGDGLIDCMDDDCAQLDNDGCEICSDGLSFADVLIEYISGCPNADPEPEGAIGVSDYFGGSSDPYEMVFLGQGGILKLGFTNNLLSNSGDDQQDLWVFEVGPLVESSNLALRPYDAYTESELTLNGLGDINGDGFYEFGNISGSTSGLDIDQYMPGYTAGQLKFDAVEIQDVDDGSCGGSTPGADIDAVCALFSIDNDCGGNSNGGLVLDDCGECLDPDDPNFNQSCADCNGTPNGTFVLDGCNECLDPEDPDFNQSCLDCNGTPNGTFLIDNCGNCLDPNDPSFNQDCTDCNGTPNGNFIVDQCGECLDPDDENFNLSCADCIGTPNGTFVLDECNECLDPDDPDFNQSCLDCNGTPNGTFLIDNCGNCLEPDDPSFNQSCLDCNGEINGSAVFDECGICLDPNDPEFNQSCAENMDIYIPNVFSIIEEGPNGRLQIFKDFQTSASIHSYQIFDRWGNQIYQRSNFEFDSETDWWNGQFQGEYVLPGVFVYLIEIHFASGDTQILKGDITVLE